MAATLPSLMAALIFILFTTQVVTATKQPQQWKGTNIATVNGATAEQVWPLFADFCNAYRVVPIDVSFCVVGVPGKIGQQRYLASKLPSPSGDNTTFISWERHNLVAINQKKRYVRYEMMENNQSIKTYISTMTVLKAKNGSKVRWDYIIDPIKGQTHQQFHAQLKMILQQAVDNLEKTFSST